MSKETDTTQRVANIPPRKVSLRREDSGYTSIIGTPADTPCVMSGRKSSRAEPSLEGIPERSDQVQSMHRGLITLA